MEFLSAKENREHVVSRNDKATVEALLQLQDSVNQTKNRITEIEDAEKQKSFLDSLALQLAHSRDNTLILSFLEELKGTEHRTKLFHALVLKLTCNDDWNTLDSVLVSGKDLDPGYGGGNPIIIASGQVSLLLHIFCEILYFLQGYLQCTKLLYGSGYEIAESKTAQEEDAQNDEAEKAVELKNLLDFASILPGEWEWKRQKSVVDSKAPDQVRF